MAEVVITAVTAVLAVMVGAFFTRDAEYRRWLREERYTLSARLLTAAQEARTEFAHQHSVAHVARAVVDPNYDEAKVWGHLHQRAADEVDALAARLGLSLTDELRTSLLDLARKEQEAAIQAALGLGPKEQISQVAVVRHAVITATEAVKLLAGQRVAAAAEELRDATLALGASNKIDPKAWAATDRRYAAARSALIQATQQEIVPPGKGKPCGACKDRMAMKTRSTAAPVTS
jgi:hypothetical protein